MQNLTVLPSRKLKENKDKEVYLMTAQTAVSLQFGRLSRMSRLLWVLIFYSATVQVLSMCLTLLKSRLSDITEVDVGNMLNIEWLWTYRWYVLGVVFIAIPWLVSTLMTAQLAKELSHGTQTAAIATLAALMVSSVVGFLQFFVFQVLRAEDLPSFGLNRVWINITLFALLSAAGSYLAFDTIQRLRVS